MSTKKLTLEELQLAVKTYVEERDWQQFHSPKNLSMAISIEAAELMELFRFMSCQDSKKVVEEEKQKVAFELADITIAVLGFCNLYEIDLGKSIVDKLNHNAQKYPIAKAKGSNKKYHHYQENS
jgi:dCTP diphosphatase